MNKSNYPTANSLYHPFDKLFLVCFQFHRYAQVAKQVSSIIKNDIIYFHGIPFDLTTPKVMDKLSNVYISTPK